MKDISTRQLRAFVALADARHFTRAAQRCHLTQPAFSAVIRSLELGLGARLFDRSTRSVDLTPEGQVFEASARRLLADFDLAQSDLGDHLSRRRGHVAVAALPSLAAALLPDILARYRQAYPGVTLTLVDALAGPCLDKVRSAEVDMALASRRDDMSGLASTFLMADRFHVVCREDHPLARQDEVAAEQLLHWPIIHMSRASSVRQGLEQLMPALARHVAFEVDHLATAMGLVQAGLGISIVPAMTLFHFQRPGLTILPLAGDALTRSLYVVHRQGRTFSSAAQALYDEVIQTCATKVAG
ncbi:MAG: LysR family transcriptional regulator [Comamonadaceae bacterium]|nr:MAG: LysR family transcriptional regulator [Comamonadaceae bacterium]